MADAVTTHLYDSGNEIEIHITNISDGTGESLVTKIDRHILKRGDFIKKLNLREIRWNIQGFTSVRFYWNHTVDDNIVVLANSGYDYYVHGLNDPNTSGDIVTAAIGDVLLSTAGAVAGATYDIRATFVAVE
jgi:hypothetical protein